MWDLTEAQIDRIEASGESKFYFDVVSPIDGTVTMRHVAQGHWRDTAAMLCRLSTSRVINEDAPHRICSRRKKVSPPIPIDALTVRASQFDPRLIHQLSRLQGMIRSLVVQPRPRQLAQRVVDHRQ